MTPAPLVWRLPVLPWDERVGVRPQRPAGMSQVMGTPSPGQLDPGPSVLVLQEADQGLDSSAGREGAGQPVGLWASRDWAGQVTGSTGHQAGRVCPGHRYVDVTVGRKVSSLWAPCPLGGQPLPHAHLQAEVEDKGALVQFPVRDVSPKASQLSISENVQ